MRAIFAFAAFLLGIFLFTSPVEAAADSACVSTCVDLASAMSPVLNLEFYQLPTGRTQYELYCQGNPKGPELFPDDKSQASIKARLTEYCKYNPAFRMCFVCERLKNKKLPKEDQKPLESSADVCRKLIAKDDYQNFIDNVAKPVPGKKAEGEPEPEDTNVGAG